MSAPRGVEDRLQWMVDHEPGEAGMCANWTWQAMGGDYGNPPRWGAEDANEVVEKVRAAGGLFTSREAPRGAFVLYTSSTHGHMCLSKGYQHGYDIMTTDPDGRWGTTGTWTQQGPIDDWGQKWAGWAIRYNGVLLPMSEPGPVYVDRLYQGSGQGEPSDSVTRLQDILNHTSIPAPGNVDLPPTGYWGEQTTTVVNAWQKAQGYPLTTYLTDDQADKLFASWQGYEVIHADEPIPPDPEPEPPDPEPEPPEQPGTVSGYGSEDWYSGKKAGPVAIKPGAGWTDLPGLVQPPSGITEGNPHDHHFSYFRVELTEESTAKRLFEVRWVRSDGDATGYDHRLFDPSVRKSYGFGTYHTERGSGLGGKWQAKVSGGSDPVNVTTHYAKTEIEWQDAQADAARVMSATFGLPPAAVRVIAVLALLVLAGLVVVTGAQVT